MTHNAHLVSVIVPVFNERKTLESCLKALKEQTYPSFEIIVVDNASTDGTAEIAKRYAAKVLFEARRGITFAKNTGIKAAQGEFIATTDADCTPDKNWLAELATCFSGPAIASAGGAHLISPDSPDVAQCVDFLLRILSSAVGSHYISRAQETAETSHNPGCNVMYRSSVLRELEGFNETLLTVEDEELDFRIRQAGYRIIFTPRALVHHKRRSTYKGFAGQLYRYAIGRMQFLKLHPTLAQWPRLMPSLLLMCVLITFLAGLFKHLFLGIFIIEIVAGAIVLLAAAYVLARQAGQKKHFFLFLALLTIGFWSWAIGFLKGLWYSHDRKHAHEALKTT